MKLCVTISLVLCVLCPSAHTVRTTAVQQVEMKDASDFLDRLKQERLSNLLQGATWTLIHDYHDFKHVEEVMKYVQNFNEALDAHEKGNSDRLAQFGGVRRFKDQLALWLNDDEQAVRAYAAVMLGICGDRAYATQLSNLLKPRMSGRDDLIHYDRGRAAMALGLVGAKEYESSLVRLLSSKNEYDRSGAAYGLGYLAAKAHASAIAKLLDDKDEHVRAAAKESLQMMGAADLIKSQKPTRAGPQ